MMKSTSLFVAVVLGLLSAGCMTFAPGAAQVKMTTNSADVKGCAVMGNVRSGPQEPPEIALRNQAVGLNANVVFRTSAVTGVAYDCKKTGP